MEPSVLLVCCAEALTVTDPLTDALAEGEETVTSSGDPAELVVEDPDDPLPELDPDPELDPEPELEPDPEEAPDPDEEDPEEPEPEEPEPEEPEPDPEE